MIDDPRIEQYRAATQLSDEGKYESALNAFHSLETVSSNPSDIARLRIDQVVCLTNLGMPQQALKMLEEVEEEKLDDHSKLLFMFESSRVKVALGDSAPALMLLTQALRISNNMNLTGDIAFIRDGMLVLQAILLAELGCPDQAVSKLEKVSPNQRGWDQAHRSLGDCYVQLGEFKKAIKIYKEILDEDAGVSEQERDNAIRNIGFAYFYNGDCANASKFLRMVSHKFASFPEFKNEIDRILKRCG